MIDSPLPATQKATENSFNAVRLLAAIQVAYIHATAALHLEPLPGYEWIAQFPGVPIFFAISGYLVFDSLLRLSLQNFAAHRAARIYPALIVNIAVLESLLAFAGQSRFSLSYIPFFVTYAGTASDGIAAALTHGGARTFPGFFQIYPSGVLWTLTVELTFYATVPLFALFRSRLAQTATIIAASLASFFYQKHLGSSISKMPVSLTVIPYFWMFGIGMLFRLWKPPTVTVSLGTLVLLAAFLYVAWFRQLVWFEWKVDPISSASVQTVLLCLLALCLGCSPILRSRVLARNDLSYGLYLYHMLIVTALMNIPQDDRTRWLLCVVLGGSLFLGYLSWHLIERPGMNFVRRKRVAI